MQDQIKEIVGLDRMIHDPSRLAILTVLSVCEEADFTYLVSITGLTRGNLSSHIAKLEESNLIKTRKTFKLKRPVTFISLTDNGKKAIVSHWEKLEALRQLTLASDN